MALPTWHATDQAETLTAVGSSESGLSMAEAERRLERDGPNVLRQHRGVPWVRKLAEQFLQPLVVVLIAAGVLSAILGDHVDAAFIAVVVFLNGLLGFFQEYRAERAIAALGELVTTEATVLRDGALRRLPSARLVVGDVVELRAGDAVPADLRLLWVKDLRVEEAALTGESVPIGKVIALLPPDIPLADRRNLAFAASAVTYGQGRGVVVAVGMPRRPGASRRWWPAPRAVTPLTARIERLSQLLVTLILGTACALFAIEMVRGRSAVETFNAAVALAVGAIPEGLPAAVTVLLAVGVSSMARRNALIRRLPAVETLGSTTVICSDKTGTLTENQMTVTTLSIGGVTCEVTGVGFAPNGEVRCGGVRVDADASPGVVECLRAGALCNDTRLVLDTGPRVEGDPTEAALTVAALKLGLDATALASWARRDAVPFESEHMYMATLHDRPSGAGTVMYVKGSSDVLLERCVDQLGEDGASRRLDAATVHREVESMHGLWVLLVARRWLEPDRRSIGHEDVAELTLVALVGMIDPPRPEAKEAVARCRGAGVKVKMITGDHAVTAAAIAAELGLEGERTPTGALRALTGRDLAYIPDGELGEIADRVAIFARRPGAEARPGARAAGEGACRRHDRRQGQRCARAEAGRYRYRHGPQRHGRGALPPP